MRKICLALAFLLLACALRAEDVPQFRGVGGAGVSAETDLPLEWGEQRNLRWKAALPGRGLSAPVVAAGRVYVTACSGYKQTREHVLCFDLTTGKKLWERQLWATGTTLCHPKTNMAAPTPVTDGRHVYALFATGDLACYDRDGNLVWYRSLVGDYPTVGNNVGMATSPVLWHDTLVVCLENVGESFAAGIDARTGENRWRIDRPRGINWVTPLVIRNQGNDEVLLQGPSDLTAHDPATGAKKWSLTGQSLSTIPSPVWGDGLVFTVAGKFLAVKPGTEQQPPTIEWQSPKLRPSYCSPLLYRGRIYTVAGNGIVSCAEATSGKVVWTHRITGGREDEQYSASPLAGAGRIYVLGEKGTATVLQAGGDEAKVLASNTLPDTFLASPVASGGALLLRSDQALYCIGEKK
jgi:outer membrane protein assembly factor BamB